MTFHTLPTPEYIRVRWHHDASNRPVEMHYEVMPDRAVRRKVDIFADGHAEADTLAWHARRYPAFQGDSLVDGEMPTVAELRVAAGAEAPGELEVFASTRHAFEAAFRAATPLIEPKEEDE
jgi:hypothetical protein